MFEIGAVEKQPEGVSDNDGKKNEEEEVTEDNKNKKVGQKG